MISTKLPTLIIADSKPQAERRSVSFGGCKLIEMACFPFSKIDCQERAKFQLTIIVNGIVSDIIVQERPYSTTANADLDLVSYYMAMESDGWGYSNKEDFLEDIKADEPDFNPSNLHEVNIEIKLEVRPV